jgi:catechol 2,3-dioxygenase-like lactoylglutathione lyase family enzyme
MTGIHHVDLVVSSLERSLPFYRELLAPLGYTRAGEVVGERGETIWYLGGAGVALGLREARTPGVFNRLGRSPQPKDRMPGRLREPVLVRRVERDVEERARHAAELVVAPQHRHGLRG